MVDLKGQYEKIQEEIDTAVLKVIREANFINGPEVVDFTKNLSTYFGGAHVIPCANGTDALQIAMMALDLKSGDEVLISAKENYLRIGDFAEVEITGAEDYDLYGKVSN